jgi:guanylate kinase
MLKYNNFIIILSAPSGAGKSTIISKLLELGGKFKLSVSATTRSPRGNERNGTEYYFLSKEEFERKISNDEFVEYALVHGNYYGTLKNELENIMNSGLNVMLDIEWLGARNVSKQFDKTKILKIFVLPPSIVELEKRLKGRGTDSDEIISGRIFDARGQISHYNEYDYVIINDDIDKAIEQITAVITAKILQNTPMEDFIKNMGINID